MTYALGIDVGTTYTAAAIARDGRAEVAALGYRATSVPTVVLLTEDGRFLVGDAAERRASHEPDRVAREFKRRVGDPTPLLLGGTPVAVDRCLAEVLRWVVTTVAEAEGEPPATVTVTHPANWGEFKRDVLREALRLVDAPESRLLPEPVAAATWYAQAERMAPGRTIVVYDLGGGTFDTTVLRRRPDGQFESLGRPEGIERLGGIDIDEAVLGYVLRTVSGGDEAALARAEDGPGLRTATTQLRRACVEAKEALSSETSVTIPVWLPGLYQEILMNRSELEALVEPLLRPTVEALERVVASAGLQAHDLDAVLLVGGSSRIPLIAQQVSAGLGRPIAVDAHPKHPVALGAALDAEAHLATLPAARGPAPQTATPLSTAPPSLAPVPVPVPVPAPVPVPVPVPQPSTQPPAWSPNGPVTVASQAPAPVPARPLPTPPPYSPPPRIGDDDRSGRRVLLLAWVVTPLTVLLVMYVGFRLSRDAVPDDGTSTDGTKPNTEVVDQGADGGTTETTAPAAPVNLLTSDPAPAIDGFATIYETPPRVRQLILWPDDASVEVQVPDNPTYVDEYRWEEGQVTGPEPQELMDMEVDELEAKLFDLAEINPAVVPVVAQQTLQTCVGEGLELTHVIIERDLALDDAHPVKILVYASNPVRGGGGYISFALDGTLIDNYCD